MLIRSPCSPAHSRSSATGASVGVGVVGAGEAPFDAVGGGIGAAVVGAGLASQALNRRISPADSVQVSSPKSLSSTTRNREVPRARFAAATICWM